MKSTPKFNAPATKFGGRLTRRAVDPTPTLENDIVEKQDDTPDADAAPEPTKKARLVARGFSLSSTNGVPVPVKATVVPLGGSVRASVKISLAHNFIPTNATLVVPAGITF